MEEHAGNAISSTEPTNIASRRLRGDSVLVVDDDPFARTVLADAMKERGFAVVEVGGRARRSAPSSRRGNRPCW